MTTAEYTVTVESSVELLRTIAAVLDIRTVFPQISEIANKVVAHDLLTMMFNDGGGEILIEAASTDEFRGLSRFVKADNAQPEDGVVLIDDFATAALPVVEPIDLRDRILAAGFRSLLVVLTRAGQQQMGLGFWSKQPRAFSRDDVPAARRIADHVALAVSHEQLAEAARKVAEAHARAELLEARVRSLTEELRSKADHARVVGRSAEWKDILKQATQVADTETTVLLTGESGTGKEVIARFIHRASPRKSGPFVALNCAALPEQLLESELFGYERGAFTGAQQAKPGQIELAGGGVLFLDEVSEMSPSAQAKFLRVLQEREFQRLGAVRPQRANVRVIAATNRDLKKAVEADGVRHLHPAAARTRGRHPRLERRVPRGDREVVRAAAGRPHARRARGAAGPRLAGERPRAAQRARARGDRLRGRSDQRRAPVAAAAAARAARGRVEPRCRRAGDDRTGDARVPREQVEGRQAARPLAEPAVLPAAEVRARCRPGGNQELAIQDSHGRDGSSRSNEGVTKTRSIPCTREIRVFVDLRGFVTRRHSLRAPALLIDVLKLQR